MLTPRDAKAIAEALDSLAERMKGQDFGGMRVVHAPWIPVDEARIVSADSKQMVRIVNIGKDDA